MDEYEYEIEQIKKLGIKDSALRLEYEEKVRALKTLPQKLRAEGSTGQQHRRDKTGVTAQVTPVSLFSPGRC